MSMKWSSGKLLRDQHFLRNPIGWINVTAYLLDIVNKGANLFSLRGLISMVPG